MCCSGEKLVEVIKAEVRRAIEEAGLGDSAGSVGRTRPLSAYRRAEK